MSARSETSATFYTICLQSTQIYRSDLTYRRIFHFDAKLKQAESFLSSDKHVNSARTKCFDVPFSTSRKCANFYKFYLFSIFIKLRPDGSQESGQDFFLLPHVLTSCQPVTAQLFSAFIDNQKCVQWRTTAQQRNARSRSISSFKQA